MALYNERVYAYERMKDVSNQFDKQPTNETISQFIADDQSHTTAFKELEHYSKHKTFLFKHHLLQQFKQLKELEELRIALPDRFANELVNASKNITRYTSYLKNKKYKDDTERISWQSLLDHYQKKKIIMTSLLS